MGALRKCYMRSLYPHTERCTLKNAQHAHFDKKTTANAASAHRVFPLRFVAGQSLVLSQRYSVSQAGNDKYTKTSIEILDNYEIKP